MLIDWFTVGAQVLNFLVLVWLMKRFLYKPILEALDARERRIAAELANADAQKADAQKEREAFAQKNTELDQQRATLLDDAKQQAAIERQRLMDEARSAAEAMGNKRQQALQREQQTLIDDIGRCAKEEVFAIARKSLLELADVTLEEHMVSMFTQHLATLSNDDKSALVNTLKNTSDSLRVNSAFELSAPQQDAIRQALSSLLGDNVPLHFESSSTLICGMELVVDGWKVAWNIDDYLATLEQRVGDLIQHQTNTTKVEANG